MKVRCLYNTGESLRSYEYSPLEENILGRFGVTAHSEYGDLEIGKIYSVMGIIIFETYQAYLIDDDEFVFACPCQLFEVTDNKVDKNWYFRSTDKNEDIYPFIQATLGYFELCDDKKAYENLIIEKDANTEQIYFKRKKELENPASTRL